MEMSKQVLHTKSYEKTTLSKYNQKHLPKTVDQPHKSECNRGKIPNVIC